MRLRQLTATAVREGRVLCPVTNRTEDVETCLRCARLAEVEADAEGDAPRVVRCRLAASWRDAPITLIR